MSRDVTLLVVLGTLVMAAAILVAPTREAAYLVAAGFAGVVSVGLLVWGIGAERGWWQ